MEPSYVDDVRYETKPREEPKLRFDETRVSRREVDTEKITVMKSDIFPTEETERQKYPVQREVGRLVIEELPEKVDKASQKYPVRQKPTEVTVTREQVSDVSRPYEKEDMIKVGRLDIHQLEKTHVEPRRIQERPLRDEEKVEHLRKVKWKRFHK